MTPKLLKYIAVLSGSALISFLGVYISAVIAVNGNAAIEKQANANKSASPSGEQNIPKKQKPDLIDKKIKKRQPIKDKVLNTKTNIVADITNLNTNKGLTDILSDKKIQPDSPFEIEVIKSKNVLIIYYRKISLKSYRVELGPSPKGHKFQEGDGKTPEGKYTVIEKNTGPLPPRLGSRWLRINYPNNEDAKRALKKSKITTDTYNAIINANNNGAIPPQRSILGGGLGLHGASGPNIETRGCIGLRNADIEELYDYIKKGTPVIIKP